MPISKDTLLSTYRDRYPHLVEMDDTELYQSLVTKFPEYKEELPNHEADTAKSYWDSMPNVIKSGYNKSLQGMAQQIATGEKRFDLSGYDPGVMEDLASEVMSFVMPADFALTLATGGIGAAIGKKTIGKLALTKLVRNGANREVTKRVINKIGAEGVKAIGASVGAGTVTLGTYQGAGSALRQKIETGEIQPGKVVKESAKGALLGGVTAGVGGYLTTKGASTLTKVASEIGVFGTGAPLLEGEIPTPQDYVHTAGMILGIKGVHGALKSPAKIKEIAKRGTLFAGPRSKIETITPTKSEAQEVAVANVTQLEASRISSETWRSRYKRNIEGHILKEEGGKYVFQDTINNTTRKISKKAFHREFTIDDKGLTPKELKTNSNNTIKGLEKKLRYGEKISQAERLNMVGEGKDTGIVVESGSKKSKPIGEDRISLDSMSQTQINNYRNRLLREVKIRELKSKYIKEGWNVPVPPDTTFVESLIPKPLLNLLIPLRPAKFRGTNDPARRKYVVDVMKFQDNHTKLTGLFLERMAELGVLDVSKKMLKESGFLKSGVSISEAKEAYWENMSKRKEVGELAPWNSFTDLVFNLARESGVEIPGYIPNYVPKVLKSGVADIIFNDLLLIEEQMTGTRGIREISRGKEAKGDAINQILSAMSNVDNWSKENPKAAGGLNSIIEKSMAKMSPETVKMIRANMTVGEFSSLKAYSIVGRTVYNDLYNPFGNLEKKRVAKLPQELYDRNLARVMSKYATGVARRIAEVEAFGLKGEKYNALSEMVRKRGNMEDYKVMNELHNHVTGLIKHSPEFNYSNRTKKFWQNVMEWETGTKIALGFATIPNVTQFTISTAMDAGYWRFFRGMASLSDKKIREQIKTSGATNYNALAEMMGLNATTTLTSGIVDKLAKYSGFNGINRVNQILAAATARVFVQDLNKISRTGVTASRRKWANEKLLELGVKPSKDKLSNEAVKTAMERFARKTQLQKDILEDPLIFNNPRAMMFTQFKRFGYRQYQFSKNLMVDDLKRGNVLPIIRLALGGYAGGEFVHLAKKWMKWALSGEEYFDPNAPQELKDFYNIELENMVDNLAAVGSVGFLGDIMASTIDEGGSVSNSLKFLATPPFISDIENLFNRVLFPLERDFKTFQHDAIRRAPVRVLRFGSGVLNEISKNFETSGMTMDRLKSLRSRQVTKTLNALEKAFSESDYDNVYSEIGMWNKTHPQFPISGEDINNRAIYKRKLRRYKRQALEN